MEEGREQHAASIEDRDDEESIGGVAKPQVFVTHNTGECRDDAHDGIRRECQPPKMSKLPSSNAKSN